MGLLPPPPMKRPIDWSKAYVGKVTSQCWWLKSNVTFITNIMVQENVTQLAGIMVPLQIQKASVFSPFLDTVFASSDQF